MIRKACSPGNIGEGTIGQEGDPRIGEQGAVGEVEQISKGERVAGQVLGFAQEGLVCGQLTLESLGEFGNVGFVGLETSPAGYIMIMIRMLPVQNLKGKDTYALTTLSTAIPEAYWSKLKASMEAACSKRALALGSEGIRPESLPYLLTR
jgi:hypothetical protein